MSQIKLYPNGFIVKSVEEIYRNYSGIEGNCWNIDEDTEGIEVQERKYLYNYYSQYIDLSWTDENHVDVCSDIKFINRYISTYLKANVKFEVLFCETLNERPSFNQFMESQTTDNFTFIGFDYAYPGGSFYSCVFSEVYSKRISAFLNIELNKFGLINSEEELLDFIKRRDELILKDEQGIFEKGKFIIYKLWKYIGAFPVNIN
jgi:hypothetical protein